jgi:transcriptional regulator with XRE-family HTH domain
MNISLGKEIRALRLQSGRTQEEVAAALDVTPQAVSRWEKSICYPDMELLPVIANYFSVTIDALFGYRDEREKTIDEIVCRIRKMNAENNGKNVSMDECERLAREAAAEYPENEKILLCLASVLFNAGYVRRGEYHATGADGLDYYDAEGHRAYPEWREAIRLYEKLLSTLPEGSMRQQAVREVIQLYANIGENERAAAIAETCPPMEGCREWLLAYAHDGKERAGYLGKLLLKLIVSASDQMIQLLISLRSSEPSPELFIGVIKDALGLYDAVLKNGEYGFCHAARARLYLFLSEFEWRAGLKDDAFASLDRALEHADRFDRLCIQGEYRYASPLLRFVSISSDPSNFESFTADLPEVWPWWQVPDFADVKADMQADPRWEDWCARCRKAAESPG